mgnify:CR=1 FL=1
MHISSEHISPPLLSTTIRVECESTLSYIPLRHLKPQVKQADVHASFGKINEQFLYDSVRMISVFQMIGELPNLVSLQIDLGFAATMPLQALICLFQENSKLKSLSMQNLQLEESCDETLKLEALLKKNHQLQKLRLANCQDSSAVSVLLSGPRRLTSIELDNTSIASNKTSSIALIAEVIQSPKLKSLSLLNVPNFHDENAVALAVDLSLGKSCLKVLTIVSSVLGRKAGKAIAKMLHFNKILEKLCLHIDFDQVGFLMSNALEANSTLQGIDLRIFGDDDIASNTCLSIAKSLRSESSALRKLRLRLEIEPAKIEPSVLEEFQATFQTNNTLENIVLDDSMTRCRLPDSLKMKLALNRSGISKLLKADAIETANYYERVVEAMISEKDCLDVLFYTLSEVPALSVRACQANSSPASKSMPMQQASTSLLSANELKNNDNASTTARSFDILPAGACRTPKITWKVLSLMPPLAY